MGVYGSQQDAEKMPIHVHKSPFPLSGAASPPVDVAMSLRHVMLLFHGAKMSSLPLLYLSVMLHHVTSTLELKPKH
jgi:hypothetical protein